MNILKIANIVNTPNTGMGRVMHMTAEELRGMGHSVDILFGDDVPRSRLGRADRFGFPVALVKAVRERQRRGLRDDVVEIHEPLAAWYCLSRRRHPSLPPCVLMSHGLEETQWRLQLALKAQSGQKTSLKSRILVPMTLLSQARYGLRHCQQVMCLNSSDEKFLREEMAIPAERVSRITNGVSERFFIPRPSYERCERLLFVGTWLEKKGRRTLVGAFARLKERHPSLQLSLVGTGIPADEVRSLLPAALQDSVRVEPRVNDAQLLEEYRSHDLFVFPSYYEPWGLVLLEAAATGLPIVTTCVGGPADLFRNRQDALLVPVAHTDALIQAVETLIGDPDLRRRLGGNGRRQTEQYTWRAAAQSQLCAYERALAVGKDRVS